MNLQYESVWPSSDFLSQTANNLDTVLEVKASGSKDFYPWRLDWCPSGCRQLLSPGHIRCVSASLIWAPEDLTVHSCAFPNPRCPAVCHTLTLMPSSLTCFQVEVPLIWSQITSSTIIKLSLRIQTHTCIQKTYCFVFFQMLSPLTISQ